MTARKSAAKRKSAPRADTRPPEVRLGEAVLAALAEEGIAGLAPRALGERAGTGFAPAYRLAPTHTDALALGLARVLEEALAAGVPDASAETLRDRVFDVVMALFDALVAHRDALAMLRSDLKRDASLALTLRPALAAAAAQILDAAGARVGGLGGSLRANALALVLADTAARFIDDEPGLSRTMAHLDRRLRQSEGLVRRFGV